MNLVELRLQKNASQKEIADELNINRTTYRSWEKEINEPNIEALKKLADYYQVSIDRLVGRQFTNALYLDSLTDEQKKIINMIIELEPIQVAKVYVYLQALTGNLYF